MKSKLFIINDLFMFVVKLENKYEFQVFNSKFYTPISSGTIGFDGTVEINTRNAKIILKMDVRTVKYVEETIPPTEIEKIGKEIISWIK